VNGKLIPGETNLGLGGGRIKEYGGVELNDIVKELL
jgi:hypothetical protein